MTRTYYIWIELTWFVYYVWTQPRVSQPWPIPQSYNMVPKSISSPVTLLHVLCVFQIWMWRCRFLTATEQENNQQSIFIRVCFNENRLPLKIHWTIIIYKLHRIAACFKNPGYVVVVIVFFAFFLSHCMWCQAVCNLVGNPRKLVMSLKKNGSKGAFVKWQEFLQHLKWWIGRNWSVFFVTWRSGWLLKERWFG